MSTVTIPLETFDKMRDEISELKRQVKDAEDQSGYSEMSRKLEDAQEQYNAYNRHNHNHRTELDHCKEELKKQNKQIEELLIARMKLMHRNLWQRIFNT